MEEAKQLTIRNSKKTVGLKNIAVFSWSVGLGVNL